MLKNKEYPIRRMRVTLPLKVANELLLPVLSKVCRIHETSAPSMVITMDFSTFGLFMAEVAKVEPAISLKNLGIEYVDLRQEPTRITVRHGLVYTTDEEI